MDTDTADSHIPTTGYTSTMAKPRKDPSRSRSQGRNQNRSPSIPSQSRVHRSHPENQTHAQSPRRGQTQRGPLQTNATARQQSPLDDLQLWLQRFRIFQIRLVLMKISPMNILQTNAIPAKRHD
jgi:hypothetical protein